MFNELDILLAVKKKTLKQPVTKDSDYDISLFERLVEGGLIKAVKTVPLAHGIPEFRDCALTYMGEQRIEQLQAVGSPWSLDRRLVVLGIFVALVGSVVTLLTATFA